MSGRTYRRIRNSRPEHGHYRVIPVIRDGPSESYVMDWMEAESIAHRLNSLSVSGEIQSMKGFVVFKVIELTPNGEVTVN